ncbi:hypothetical protein VTG60DRAFT_4634 [Thermothelomyces hinnuleus]
MVKQLTQLRDDVLKTVKAANQDSNDLVPATTSEQLRLADEVRSTAENLLTESTIPTSETRILRQLYFSTLYSREEAVHKAEDGTFEWLLNDETTITDHGDDENEREHKDNIDDDDDDDDRRLRLRHGWLYRAILFEILKQSPELIRETFPEAYDAFSRNGTDMSLDKQYILPQQLERGMEALISKAPYPGHRICLFVDGLDEYGGEGTDEPDHERLAKQPQSWASREGVKVLVSSRSHREFEQVFPDERRIRLHELTRLDIYRFTCNAFKQNKHFAKLRKKDVHYLVQVVVEDSDNVFLWVRFAIRSLLTDIRHSSKVSYLLRRLDRMPKDLSQLYRQMFDSIDPADRPRAAKLLLLVTGAFRTNALTLTWLDDLEDETFPMSRSIQPYSECEIHERLSAARRQLGRLTQGLFELADTGFDSTFYSKEIRCVHRTVRDFVHDRTGNSTVVEFRERYPDFGGEEMQIRRYLAEFWLARTEDLIRHGEKTWTSMIHTMGHFRFPSRRRLAPYLEGLRRAITHHVPRGSRGPPRCNIVFNGEFVDPGVPMLQASHYAHNGPASNFCGFFCNYSGASPNEKVKVKSDNRSTATPWMIFCIFFAACMLYDLDFSHSGKESSWRRQLAERLELLLATREVDPDRLVLLSTNNDLKKLWCNLWRS